MRFGQFRHFIDETHDRLSNRVTPGRYQTDEQAELNKVLIQIRQDIDREFEAIVNNLDFLERNVFETVTEAVAHVMAKEQPALLTNAKRLAEIGNDSPMTE